MQTQFKRILCPVDFDDNSLTALDLAGELAREHEARLFVLHVLVPVLPSAEMGMPLEPLPMDESEALEELRKLVGEHVQEGVERTLTVRIGDPASAILKETDSVGADLVVMATHGRKGLKRLLLGSVAARVVREANCPVLTVRATRNKAAVAA